MLVQHPLHRACQLARKAVQLDPNLPEAHAALGQALSRMREHEAAVAEFERAMALNPNFTGSFGEVLLGAGDPVEALSGKCGWIRSTCLGAWKPWGSPTICSGNMRRRCPLSREWATRTPNFRAPHVLLAATHAQLGNIEQARAEAAEVLRIEPKYTIEGTQARLTPFKRPEDAEHLFDGLRKAGLPER